MKLIYIGDHFYMESGTMMSSIYTEDGKRSDWGFVQIALKRGDSVEIRQATQRERDFYEGRLAEMKRARDSRVEIGATKMHNVEVTGLAAASLPQGPCGLPGSTPASTGER